MKSQKKHDQKEKTVKDQPKEADEIQLDGQSDEETGSPNLEEMPETLEKLQEERDEYLNHLQRLKAEFDNYRKRVEREKEDLRVRGTANLVVDLLEVLDNFERAMESAKASGEDQTPFGEGVQMTYKMLFESLKKRGLEAVESLGQPFDPEFHEAMSTEPHSDMAPNTVVNEWQKGYLFGEKVLRPAKVVVSVKE